MAREYSEMKLKLPQLRSALQSFASSSDNFRILSSVPVSGAHQQASTLYVLDCSFNPPTRAHLLMATSALLEDCGSLPKRLLLLLATQNADKAAKPASFEERLAMMSIFASDIRSAIVEKKSSLFGDQPPEVDIGVTKFPYFHDKAAAVTASKLYPANPTQVHLAGYDTLIRILNPKYYPPDHNLRPLDPFLSRHRLRITYRTGDEWGDHTAQREYLHVLENGGREHEGGKREWADGIELVEGKKEGDEPISSTKVRNACKTDDQELLGALLSDGVRHWVADEKLYREDE